MKDDPFIAGPLSDPAWASASVVKRYQELRNRVGAADPDEAEDGAIEQGLPSREVLNRGPVSPQLFDYQRDLTAQITEVAQEPPPANTALVALPTGAGKTRTALSAVLGLLSEEKIRRMLWLAPARELLDQAFATMRTLWWGTPGAPPIELLRCHALQELPACRLPGGYFSTPQMAGARLAKEHHLLPRFDFVIFDEAHQAEARTFKQTLTSIRSLGQRVAPAIGLSATPGRTTDDETESLVTLFNSRLLTSAYLRPNALAALQNQGVLARVEFKRITLPERVVGLRRTVESRDQLKGQLKAYQWDRVRFRAVVAKAMEVQQDGQTLVFAGSVQHANALCAVLKTKGCSADVVSAYTPLQERARILKEYSGGNIRILLNKSLLATGYDCPSVKHVILTSPVGSPILFEQIVGRASRGPKVGGNATSTVWQVDNNLAIHGKPNSYHRFRDFDWK